MSKTITLFEHEYTTNIGWTDREAEKIFRLNSSLGADVLLPTFRSGQRELRAAEHVGVIRCGNQTVQILPKIYKAGGSFGTSDREDEARQASENLLYLLAVAARFPIRESEIAGLTRHNTDWFEILIYLFAKHLFEEWTKGAVHNYQTVETELGVLKGKWRISEQITRPARRHTFSVSFDEFTTDNLLNRVFRFVVERLWQITGSNDNRRHLGDLRMVMDEVRLLPHVSAGDASSSLLNRTNSRFAPLLNMARLFLEGGVLKMSSGANESFAFVFDMNALFETFLCEFIRRHRDEILPSELDQCEILPQTKNATRYLAMRDEAHVFQLKPDLSFRQPDGGFPLIVDAKYKRLVENSRRLDVSPADFYQMHAYAHRYHCDHVVLLYPQTAEMLNGLRAKFRLHESQIIIQSATINMQHRLTQATERNHLKTELREIFANAV